MKLDEDDSSGNNDLPITSGTTLILTNERFNIDLDKATSTYKLRIRDIQETDGAIYQCKVEKYLNTLYLTILLNNCRTFPRHYRTTGKRTRNLHDFYQWWMWEQLPRLLPSIASLKPPFCHPAWADLAWPTST